MMLRHTVWAKTLVVARSLDQYKYPVGHARAGQLNEEAADLKQWLVTTVVAAGAR